MKNDFKQPESTVELYMSKSFEHCCSARDVKDNDVSLMHIGWALGTCWCALELLHDQYHLMGLPCMPVRAFLHRVYEFHWLASDPRDAVWRMEKIIADMQSTFDLTVLSIVQLEEKP